VYGTIGAKGAEGSGSWRHSAGQDVADKKFSETNASGCAAIFGLAAAVLTAIWPVLVFRRHWNTTTYINCATNPDAFNINGCYTKLNNDSNAWYGQGTIVTPHSAVSTTGVIVEVVWAGILLVIIILIAVAFQKAKANRPVVAPVAATVIGSEYLFTPPTPSSPLGEFNPRVIPQDVKIQVAARDGGKCRRCGSTDDLQYDHVIPWSKGGANTVKNVQLLCGRCNRRKGAQF
jgi:HNH endonuclease